MNRQEFQALIKNKPIFLDGATGSNLQKKGMPAGVCPEQWILEHRDIMIAAQGNLWRQEVRLYMPLLLRPIGSS